MRGKRQDVTLKRWWQQKEQEEKGLVKRAAPNKTEQCKARTHKHTHSQLHKSKYSSAEQRHREEWRKNLGRKQ